MLAIVARVSIGNVTHRVAEHFHKGVDHAGISEQLGDVQHQVRCGNALRRDAGQAQSDDARRGHQRALTQHRGLRLDSANAPAKHAQPTDHRRVAIGAEQGVRARQRDPARFLQPDHGRKPFQIELMHDAAARRNQPDVGESPGAPFQEFESLSIALDLDLLIERHGVGTAAMYGNQGVIADEVDRNARIDLPRIVAGSRHGIAQRRQIGHQRRAGKILQQQARRLKIQTAAPRAFGESGKIERSRVVGLTQRAFEQDFQRQRQPARGAYAERFGALQADILNAAVRSRKRRKQRRQRRTCRHFLTTGR